MALTFEELEKWWSGKSAPNAYVTMTITQEDGRSAHAAGGVAVYDSKAPAFSGRIDQTFNDRMRQLTYASTPGYPVPVGTSGNPYLQRFDQNGGVDMADIEFIKIGSNQFELRLTLLRWGNALVTVKLTKSSRAKVYTGWGATIGAGTAQALYAFSINMAEDAVKTPAKNPIPKPNPQLG